MDNFNLTNSTARTQDSASSHRASFTNIAIEVHQDAFAIPLISGGPLIAALWRSPNHSHQISVRDKKTNKFKSLPVNNNDEALHLANTYSNSNCDAYFSCAEFQDSTNRTASNAIGAWALWMDLDCGESKAANKHGYLNCADALSALKNFCNVTGLPLPTHLVCSGSGLHVYWVLDKFLVRETWQSYATKLKTLTKSFRFLADPSRTSDIASLLRIPGTMNHKSNLPKPVTLLLSSDHFLNQENVLAAIDLAYGQLNIVNVPLYSHDASIDETTRFNNTICTAEKNPPDIDLLASALSTLDPDCDESVWALRRLAPIAREAKVHLEHEEQLYQLCRAWSSGTLRGVISHKWTTPGGNGLTGEAYFDTAWTRFVKSTYAGKPTTLHTIYFDAIGAGWIAPIERFEVIANSIGGKK